jgi:prolipoprotein diacylglyceryl transferase
MMGYLYWDPSRYVFDFSLPLLGRPLVWYGVLFALGFWIAYHIFKFLLLTYLFNNPYFHEEDIVSADSVAHIIEQNKEGNFSYVKHRVTKSFIASYLNKQIETKNCALNIKSLPFGVKVFFNSLSKPVKALVINRFYLDALCKKSVLSIKGHANLLSEKIAFVSMVGVVVGARVFDVLFYQDINLLIRDPLIIIKIWEGGLASHGGVLGLIVAVIFLSKNKMLKKSHLSFFRILDLMVIPSAFLAAMIRLGNFINQEIVGRPSSLPWAVIFAHPADGSQAVARHPVQLYEGIFYFAVFCVTILLWKKFFSLKYPGRLLGGFLLVIFMFRFFVEFFKVEQSFYLMHASFFTMGQYLSLPFIALGIYLFFRSRK